MYGETDEQMIEWFLWHEREFRTPTSQWETVECYERGLELAKRLRTLTDHAPVVSQEPAQSPIESRVDELLSETECGYCSDDFDDADLCEDCSGRLTS